MIIRDLINYKIDLIPGIKSNRSWKVSSDFLIYVVFTKKNYNLCIDRLSYKLYFKNSNDIEYKDLEKKLK